MVIDGIKVEILRKRIKNFNLSVHPPFGRVRLSVPARINDEAVKKFIRSKMKWIQKHRERIIAKGKFLTREYKNGETHFFLGKEYLLEVTETISRPKVIAESDSNTIKLFVKNGSGIKERQQILNKFYRKELIKIIPSLIKKWEQKMNLSVKEFRIKIMKTRWGTCNSKVRRIWFNLELAKKPIHCIEYIIVHEMVHFLERKHNQKFKSYINVYLPEWKTYKKELNSFPESEKKMEY